MMIKNFKQFNESLRDKLVGPSDDELLNNFKDLNPNSLLLKSSKIGFLKGVEIALERGANIDYWNNDALTNACSFGHYDIVKLLIDKGVDIHISNEFTLLQSCSSGYYDMVKLLLDNDADVHVNNDRPIRYAIEKRHEDIVKLLLDKGNYNKSKLVEFLELSKRFKHVMISDLIKSYL